MVQWSKMWELITLNGLNLITWNLWAIWQTFSCVRSLMFVWVSAIGGEGTGKPLQYSCLENPREGGAWWAAVYGVPQSRTWLKWLSSIVVKNQPANAGDAGSIPGLGRFHTRETTKPMGPNCWACALEPLNHNYWALMMQLPKPGTLQPTFCNQKLP